MMYLDPKADLTFKKIFAKHPDLLISLLSPSCPMPLCKGSKLAQYSIRETFFIRLASSCAVLFASKVVEKL